jgi:hypothetical protein
MSIVINIYTGDTVRLKATIKDYDGVLIDPDTHSIKVYNPSDVQVGSEITTPTSDGVGMYHADYDIPTMGPDGIWKCIWRTIKGGAARTGVMTFEVKVPL